MLHPNIGDGSIFKEIGTLHGVMQGGAIPEHNNLECGLGDDDTTNEQPKQKKSQSSQNVVNPTHMET